jgi:hypothetical protein
MIPDIDTSLGSGELKWFTGLAFSLTNRLAGPDGAFLTMGMSGAFTVRLTSRGEIESAASLLVDWKAAHLTRALPLLVNAPPGSGGKKGDYHVSLALGIQAAALTKAALTSRHHPVSC